ncbi:hypothetical protein, partial [Aeromonas caviae]
MSDLIDVLSKFSVHDLARMLAERIEADSQSTFKNRHDLGGGITLFKQKGSSRWHCRVHQPADGIYDYRQRVIPPYFRALKRRGHAACAK